MDRQTIRMKTETVTGLPITLLVFVRVQKTMCLLSSELERKSQVISGLFVLLKVLKIAEKKSNFWEG